MCRNMNSIEIAPARSRRRNVTMSFPGHKEASFQTILPKSASSESSSREMDESIGTGRRATTPVTNAAGITTESTVTIQRCLLLSGRIIRTSSQPEAEHFDASSFPLAGAALGSASDGRELATAKPCPAESRFEIPRSRVPHAGQFCQLLE